MIALNYSEKSQTTIEGVIQPLHKQVEAGK